MALAEPPSNSLAPVTCRLQLAGHGSSAPLNFFRLINSIPPASFPSAIPPLAIPPAASGWAEVPLAIPTTPFRPARLGLSELKTPSGLGRIPFSIPTTPFRQAGQPLSGPKVASCPTEVRHLVTPSSRYIHKTSHLGKISLK
jgi:hypothetical protein